MKLVSGLLFAISLLVGSAAYAADQGHSKGTDLSDLLTAAPSGTDPVADGAVTIKCGFDEHLIVMFAPSTDEHGKWYQYALPPAPTAATCASGRAEPVYMLDVPGAPQFASYELMKKFIEYIVDNGETIAKGKPNS